MLNNRFVCRLLLVVLLLWTLNIIWRIFCEPFEVESALIIEALLCTAGFLVLARSDRTMRKK